MLTTSCVGELHSVSSEEDPARPDQGMLSVPGVSDQGAEIEVDLGPESTPPALDPMPLRRLNRLEYSNTVRDLFGGEVSLALDELPEDAEVGGFDNNASASGVDSVLMRAYLHVAESIATRSLAHIEDTTACTQQEAFDGRACAADVLERWGERLWRRPLTSQEVEELLEVYTRGRGEDQELDEAELHRDGLTYLVSYMLLAPPFLYRLEGPAGEPRDVPRALDGWQVASRLSYFLWRSMPDEALREAARAGELEDEAGIRQQVERMLEDERAGHTLAEFHKGWLGYGIVQDPRIPRSAELFPHWELARPHVLEASKRQLSELILKQEADYEALLTSPMFFANAEMAPLYGIDSFDPAAGEWQQFERPGERFGVLTDPSFLAITGRPTYVSPVLRGYVLRERMLCDKVAEPGSGIPEQEPELAPDGSSLAQDPFANTMTNTACAVCHQEMNPIGYGLSHYDAVGGYSPLFNGETRAAKGYLIGTDVPEPFEGVAGLASRLSSSQQARDCLTRKWFRYAHGYREDERYDALIAQLGASLDTSVQELIVSIALSETFRSR